MGNIPIIDGPQRSSLNNVATPSVSPNAFGYQSAVALQELGAQIDRTARVADAYADKQKADRKSEELAWHSTRFDLTPAEVKARESMAPDGSGYVRGLKDNGVNAIDEYAATIDDPELRSAFRTEQLRRLDGKLEEGAMWSAGQAATFRREQTGVALDTLVNKVRTNVGEYDNALKDVGALIDAQPNTDEATKIRQKRQWTSELAMARFQSGLAAVNSLDGFDALAKDLTENGWSEKLTPEQYEKLIDGIAASRSAFKSAQDAKARSLLDSMETRSKDRVVVPSEEIKEIAQAVRDSDSLSVQLRYAQLLDQQSFLANHGKEAPAVTRQWIKEQESNADSYRSRRRAAVIGAESVGDPNAVSPVGATGLMQVMPGTAADIAREIGDPNFPRNNPEQIREYLKDPRVNVMYGEYYLDKMEKRYGGDLEAALIAYNAGPDNADKWLAAGRDDSVLPKKQETRPYVDKVMRRMQAEPTPDFGPSSPMTRDTFKSKYYDWTDFRNERWNNSYIDSRVVGALDYVTEKFGSKLKITSGYRDPNHPSERVKAQGGQHTHGTAIDIDVSGLTDGERAELVSLFVQSGATGMGHYPPGSSGNGTIHVDWRPNRGRQVDGMALWYGKAEYTKGESWFRDGIALGRASRTGMVEGRSAILQSRIDYARQQADEKDKRIASDPMALARDDGLVTDNPLQSPEDYLQLGKDAAAVAEYYTIPQSDMKPLTEDQFRQLSKQITEGTADEVLGMMANMQNMGPDMARAAYKQLGQTDPTFEYAAGLAYDKGDASTAADIVRGSKRLQDDKALYDTLGQKSEDFSASFATLTGTALSNVNPRIRDQIQKAALAHYVETYASRAGGAFNTSEYERSVNAVLGGRGGPAVDEVNGEITVLPEGVDADTFNEALPRMNMSDYERMSANGLGPKYADGADVDPQDIDAEGKFRAIGGDRYYIEMSDRKFLITGNVDTLGRAQRYVFVASANEIRDISMRSLDPTAMTGDNGATPPPSQSNEQVLEGQRSMEESMRRAAEAAGQ
jgi:hypothetical protein